MGRALKLLYRSKAPAHYVARFGEGGWCEGWGWTADEAIEDLARAIERQAPSGVPDRVSADPPALLEWVRGLASEPVLDQEGDSRWPVTWTDS